MILSRSWRRGTVLVRIYEANDFGHLGLCFSLKQSSDGQSGHTTKNCPVCQHKLGCRTGSLEITKRFKARVA